jgi:hypothetical protein
MGNLSMSANKTWHQAKNSIFSTPVASPSKTPIASETRELFLTAPELPTFLALDSLVSF